MYAIMSESNIMAYQSAYFPTHAIYRAIYITYIQTPTRFSTQVPSSGSYHNKDV